MLTPKAQKTCIKDKGVLTPRAQKSSLNTESILSPKPRKPVMCQHAHASCNAQQHMVKTHYNAVANHTTPGSTCNSTSHEPSPCQLQALTTTGHTDQTPYQPSNTHPACACQHHTNMPNTTLHICRCRWHGHLGAHIDHSEACTIQPNDPVTKKPQTPERPHLGANWHTLISKGPPLNCATKTSDSSPPH